MRNPRQQERFYKSLKALPYRQEVYDTRPDAHEVYRINSASAADGVIQYTQSSMVGRGLTGMAYRLGSPTGSYDDRWDRLYDVGDTGVLSFAGSTGSDGRYEISYTFDVSGVTGVAHDQYYGVEFTVNAADAPATGLHSTTQTIFHVQDTIG